MNYLTVILKGSSPCSLKLDYQLTAAPTSECSEVDFSGDALWRLESDSFWLIFSGDLNGSGTLLRDSITGLVQGNLPVIFKAPLGENSFTREGVLELEGNLIFQSDRGVYEVILKVTGKPQDFSDLESGYIELSWGLEDERIYYTGTFCFTGLNL